MVSLSSVAHLKVHSKEDRVPTEYIQNLLIVVSGDAFPSTSKLSHYFLLITICLCLVLNRAASTVNLCTLCPCVNQTDGMRDGG